MSDITTKMIAKKFNIGQELVIKALKMLSHIKCGLGQDLLMQFIKILQNFLKKIESNNTWKAKKLVYNRIKHHNIYEKFW